MVLNTGNSEGNSNGGKLHHGTILQNIATNFENKNAEIDVEALECAKFFGSNITHHTVVKYHTRYVRIYSLLH